MRRGAWRPPPWQDADNVETLRAHMKNERGLPKQAPSGKLKNMLDYIAISKPFEYKDTPNLSNLQMSGVDYERGVEYFKIDGCERLAVSWSEQARILRLKGSLPYYFQGHNFSFDKQTFEEAVDYLQGRLGAGLWDASLDAVEMGVIFEVERRPKVYIRNYHAKEGAAFLENELARSKGNFKYWEESGGDSLKMYDAGRNIKMKQGWRRREVIEQAGWNPDRDYMKIEAHIRKPEQMNGGRPFLLEDCLEPAKYGLLRARLRELYNQIEAMKTLETPTDKKNLTTQDLLALAYVEEYMNAHDCSPDEAKKRLYERINAVEDRTLTSDDKKARKRQINALFGKMKVAETSEYELGGKLEEALAAEAW